ncbi:hypothetical protein [Rhodoferax aquaticus]|uniref:MarR family transcriptional regulator n=1 Tax=Rhodoferax aquaticus TaxID=2527691 RepID=A0A515ES95_9BURK|nr:hypothetical protein [Rhodoferax aquaticus]QDL55508.1 hypothetical protein EXZ61_15745 [Rhodoferax aquaticus]
MKTCTDNKIQAIGHAQRLKNIAALQETKQKLILEALHATGEVGMYLETLVPLFRQSIFAVSDAELASILRSLKKRALVHLSLDESRHCFVRLTAKGARSLVTPLNHSQGTPTLH